MCSRPAKENSSARIDFYIKMLGLNAASTYSASIYIISASDSSIDIQPPSVLGMLPGGIVRRNNGVQKFKVSIPKYKFWSIPDAIIFLVKEIGDENKIIQLKPTYHAESDLDFNVYQFSLSYDQVPSNKRLEFYYLIVAPSGRSRFSTKLNVIFEDDSGAGTNPNNGSNTGNGNHCDNGLYNKVDVDSNYEDGKFSLKIKSITLI